MSTESQNYARLKNNFEELKLTAMSQNLDQFLDSIEKKQTPVLQALVSLTNDEIRLKRQRAVQGCVKAANFPFMKTMDDFDFDFQPGINREQIPGYRNLRFMEKAENLVFPGSPGAGKTHLSVSIGIEAAQSGKSTYFIGCTDLLEQLKKAKSENTLEKKLKQLARYGLLIIDEVGFLPIDEEASKLFFQLISKRYEKKSTIVTTNVEFTDWASIFGNAVLANAVLDRLLHHSQTIRIVGNSYRLKDAGYADQGEAGA
jgi:DNA replication protein DnaC